MTEITAAEAPQPLDLLAGWISREDLAAQLGFTPDTLARWAARHEGPPCTRIGRRVLYRRAAVLDWIRTLEQARPAPKARARR